MLYILHHIDVTLAWWCLKLATTWHFNNYLLRLASMKSQSFLSLALAHQWPPVSLTKLRITGRLPISNRWFLSQRVIEMECVSISWRHYGGKAVYSSQHNSSLPRLPNLACIRLVTSSSSILSPRCSRSWRTSSSTSAISFSSDNSSSAPPMIT